jgi:short-subunit dehydrogenase
MKLTPQKRCLITGAASGIGRAFAIQLAERGIHLALVDKDAEKLREVEQLCAASGTSVFSIPCDLSDRAAIDQMTARVLQHWQAVDLLINNAGVAFYGPTETMSQAQWDWLLQINLLAPIQITRTILPTMLHLDEAHILNVCSVAGLVASGRFAAYHVSKFGLVGFSEAMRAEYVRRGIGVTALCPGPVSTNLYNSAVSGRADRTVPTPPRWVCATSEQVAKKGIRAIEKNKAITIVTPMAHVLWRAKRFVPGFLDFLNRLTRKKHKKKAAINAATTAISHTASPAHPNSNETRPGTARIPAPHFSHVKEEQEKL